MWSLNAQQQIMMEEIAPCFYIFHIFGLQYFNLSEIASKKISRKFKILFIVQLIFRAFLSTVAFYYIFADLEPNLNENSLNKILRILVASLSSAAAISAQIITFWTTDQQKQILKHAREIQNLFCFSEVKIDYKNFRNSMLKKTFVPFVICIIIFNTALYFEWRFDGEIFGYLIRQYFYLFSFVVASAKYMFHVSLIDFHLVLILESIKNITENGSKFQRISNGKVEISNFGYREKLISVCKRAYGEILTMIDITNESFGWIVTEIFVYSLIMILVNFFGMFRTLKFGYSFQFMFGM